ncbi:HlyD family secretion protein [Syntrophothermus lipocalidus]|uniref:Secretion protein HlyD family protein n=1 Tax=Syntrophothermus lipocalidus (strain DSM 12680 / TGB-C1) TaxID=643648 RepID=D7CLC2_SYNLT|nr:HlyD family efflux transporter periplasmic adaptor subunit [Syntrophothermus lipocalidus]ADI01507.1 secretion protein HlyD family protein [Syntrophothermus lipocalidus DSM 12680]HOV43113.1 HlyD family efflux transporter periplasmic adaptor subunit [Syntrophothermus lipocalidus]
MKKRLILLLLVTALGVGTFLAYEHYYSSPQNTGIQASGTIEATTAELTAKAAGVIEYVTVKEGDHVQKGQLVAELSRNDLVAQRERDALSVLKAKAQLRDLTSGAREEEIAEAAANVEIAKASLKQATEDLTKREELYQAGAITKDELEKFQTAQAIEKQKLQAAEARLRLLKAGSRSEQITQAELEVKRCEAVLKATEAMIRDLKVFSPIDGVVLNRNYEPGEYVQAGASLATVANLNDLWIKVYIPTDDLPAIRLGQEVKITVSGSPEVFTGRVTYIASRGEYTPKMIQTKKERTNVVFAVKISVDNKDGVLKPGMPADVVFDGGKSRD